MLKAGFRIIAVAFVRNDGCLTPVFRPPPPFSVSPVSHIPVVSDERVVKKNLSRDRFVHLSASAGRQKGLDLRSRSLCSAAPPSRPLSRSPPLMRSRSLCSAAPPSPTSSCLIFIQGWIGAVIRDPVNKYRFHRNCSSSLRPCFFAQSPSRSAFCLLDTRLPFNLNLLTRKLSFVRSGCFQQRS